MADYAEHSIFTEYLVSFGLTRQEAAVYETLLQHGAMTGYEVSKETGISRSNVYASLAALADKGAAYLIQGEAARYTPVDIRDFTENTLNALRDKAGYLVAHAPEKQVPSEGYITIQGAVNIRNRLRAMLEATGHRMYLMAPAAIVNEFMPEIEALIKAGRKVVILTDGADGTVLDWLNGLSDESALYITETEPCQIRFISDSARVLTGTLSGSSADTCLYSDQKNLVAVMKEALKNRITLLRQTRD